MRLPIPLPLWVARRLPTWWRVRRVARMIRNLDAAADTAARQGRTKTTGTFASM
ncbi:MAG: hypothetical protein ABJA98_01835 [Acidobacteriota bacterium]